MKPIFIGFDVIGVEDCALANGAAITTTTSATYNKNNLRIMVSSDITTPAEWLA
jgi:hypothetical protein